MNISDTIRDQIGIGTLMRIGARQLSASECGFHFALTATTKGGARRVLWADIELTPADTYEVTISKTKVIGTIRFATEQIAQHEGIYADQLPLLLQREAGEAGSMGLRPTWEGV